ncbi:hypothetical protein D9R14_05820 [Xanthobacter tagetidis]|uniref:Uncharacterized protein n=1 Tax=Xanthobacter tagetidis TaxID=60216 RepID=A0A3L7AKL3_9HYPH|nr:hypothetical protein D9R14_05820 [Xanthobacter tagetidis]
MAPHGAVMDSKRKPRQAGAGGAFRSVDRISDDRDCPDFDPDCAHPCCRTGPGRAGPAVRPAAGGRRPAGTAGARAPAGAACPGPSRRPAGGCACRRAGSGRWGCPWCVSSERFALPGENARSAPSFQLSRKECALFACRRSWGRKRSPGSGLPPAPPRNPP